MNDYVYVSKKMLELVRQGVFGIARSAYCAGCKDVSSLVIKDDEAVDDLVRHHVDNLFKAAFGE